MAGVLFPSLEAATERGRWLADKERWENTFEVRLYGAGGFRSIFSLTVEQARIDRDAAVILHGTLVGCGLADPFTKVAIFDHACREVE